MANTIYVMEAVNLFVGDDRPDDSNHLTIQELKLPGLEENFTDHLPGGAVIGIEVDTHIQRLEATFNLAGWNPEVMTKIGRAEGNQQTFTAYGAIRDRRNGELIESIAVMQGRLGRVNPTAFRKGDLQSHEYSIRGIVHYELKMGERPIYYWDFFENARVIGTEDLNSKLNRILRVTPTVRQ